MENQEYFNISTQQINIFLKAVELKNFTQVANFFNFTPSMVSKTISALEDELGLVLFDRKPHDLKPTPAAVYLAKEWRQTISSLANSVQKAKDIQNDKGVKIVLGFVDSSDRIDRLINTAVKSYLSEHENVTILIEKHDMHREAELLSNGMLDIVITHGMEVPYLDEHRLSWEKIVDTGMCVFVPASNPLFKRKKLDFEDLKDQSFMFLNPKMHPAYAESITEICREHGFTPKITATYRTIRSLLFSLNLYDSLFIGDSINNDWSDTEIKMFPLPVKTYSVISWRDEAASDELIEFKNYLIKIYKEAFR